VTPPTLPPQYYVLTFMLTVAVHAVAVLALIATAAYGGLSGRFIWLVPTATIAAVESLGFLVLQRRAARIVQGAVEANALADQGRYDETAALLDRLAARCRLIPNLHALLAHRRATIAFALGDLVTADALDREAVRSGWLTRPSSANYVLLPPATAQLAAIAALRNDHDDAAAWSARAHASVTPAREGTLVFTDAVLLAHTGRYAEAHDRIVAVGSAGRIEVSKARTLRWILVLCLTRIAPERRRADFSKIIDEARASTREVLALTPWWPELAACVHEHASAVAS
jgi:hypothetical protein